MKKTFLTVLMLVLIAVCAVLSIINFTSETSHAKAYWGTSHEYHFSDGRTIYTCYGAESNCCVVTPNQ
jgi:hypothetical protein